MAYQCLVKKFSSCARTKMLYNISQKCANSKQKVIKLIYSEKATIFCEIFTVDLSSVVTVKSTVEISQNFVAFSEYMDFKSNKKGLLFFHSKLYTRLQAVYYNHVTYYVRLKALLLERLLYNTGKCPLNRQSCVYLICTPKIWYFVSKIVLTIEKNCCNSKLKTENFPHFLDH